MRATHRHHAGLQTTNALGAHQGGDQVLRNGLLAVRRDHQEPPHQRRHQGPVPGLHRQAGNVSAPQSSQADGQGADTTPASTRSRPSNTVCAHAQSCLARRDETRRDETRLELTRARRHKGRWWNQPQEGRSGAPWSPRLRQCRAGHQGDWRYRDCHLRPVRAPITRLHAPHMI